MSGFDTLMQRADDVLFHTRTFGTSVTYQPAAGGDPSTITVIIDHQIEPQPDDTEYRMLIDMVEIHIRIGDIAQPKRGDTLTVGAAVYTVDHVNRTDAAKLVHIARCKVSP